MALTGLLYARTLGYAFVYEDLNDPTSMFGRPIDTWPGWNRLLTSASLTLSRLISDVQPWGWHLVSVAAHLVNGALLWCLIGGRWAAVLALGLFLLHPLQVESVAYVSSRPDLLLGTCLLCGLLAVERGRWGLLALAAGAAVLAKESGIVAIPLCVLWAWWRDRVTTVRLAWAGVIFGPIVTVIALRFVDVLALDPAYTSTEVTKAVSLGARVLVPVGLTIDHDWGWITPAVAAFCWLMVAVWGCYALIELRSRFALVFAWCAIALAPRLVTPLLEGLHEHHLYVPLLGLALGVGASHTPERTLWESV